MILIIAVNTLSNSKTCTIYHSSSPSQKMKIYAHDMIETVSIDIVIHVFSECLFVGSDFNRNIYSVFGFVPMYIFCLGISKLSKECALESVFAHLLYKRALSVNDVQKSFPSVQSRILLFLNNFLKLFDVD